MENENEIKKCKSKNQLNDLALVKHSDSISNYKLDVNTITQTVESSYNNIHDLRFKWCCIKLKLCKFFNHWLYVYIVLCICVFLQNLIASGIGTVILSTIEKEFYLTSTESGLFLGVYDLAAFISSPIIGYFGGLKNSNKMRIISISLIFVSFGSYIIGCSVFMKQPDSSIYSTETEINTCQNGTTSSVCEAIKENTITRSITKHLAVVLYIGNIIIGFGSVALYSVSIAYIEEIVDSKKSSIFQAIYYGVGAIGGGIGIVLTGQFLKINSRFYLESYRKLSTLTTSNSNWIGAWWLPWLVYGLLCNLIAIYIYGFPRKINKLINATTQHKQSIENISNTQENKQNYFQENKKKVFIFLKDFKKILFNFPFICLALASATEGMLFKGFLGFISKFFEYQYQVSAITATMITGGISVFSVIFGTLLGAYIISKYNFNSTKCTLMISIIYLVTSFAFWALLFSCKENQIINVPKEQCSMCTCDNAYDPVCYMSSSSSSEAYMYQSACHLGCTTKLPTHYTTCSCISDNNGTILQTQWNETVSFLYCDQSIKCLGTLIAGGFIALFIVFSTAVALIPHLKAIMNTVDENHQSFALGIRTAIIRVIGNFSGPILFGTALDSSCLYWKNNCFNQKVCKIYKNQRMSLLLAIIGFSCRFSTFALTFIAFLVMKYREKKQGLFSTNDDDFNKVKSNKTNFDNYKSTSSDSCSTSVAL